MTNRTDAPRTRHSSALHDALGLFPLALLVPIMLLPVGVLVPLAVLGAAVTALVALVRWTAHDDFASHRRLDDLPHDLWPTSR